MREPFDFFENFFSSSEWPARWVCGNWTDFHGWLYILSDLAIWAAYFAIPLLLFRFLSQKRGIPLSGVFWLFIGFILFCGMSHLVDASMFWWPAYRVNAMVRLITALVSWVTVFKLANVLPTALKLRTSKEFEDEIDERIAVEEKVMQLNREQEHYVQKLSESEERFRTLVENVKDYAIFFISETGRIESWNKGAEFIKGYAAEEIIGRNISEFYTEKSRADGEPEQNLKMARELVRLECESLRVKKDGTLFWANIVLTALTNNSGQLLGFTKITRDITEKKLADDLVKKSNERFTTIFNLSPEAKAITSLEDGRFLFVNNTFETMFGYRKEELMGKASPEIGITDLVGREKVVLEIKKKGNAQDLDLRLRTKVVKFETT